MSWTTVDGWAGRVWVSSTGKRTFYIRAVMNGKKYDGISTSCSTLRAALKELERFEADPEAYGSPRLSVVLNEQLIEAYAKWCREHTDAQDDAWLDSKKRLLRWWAERFDGRPLTSTKLTLILSCLDGQTNRADRIKSLKHLYSWLRQTDRITAAQDPTLEALPVPQSRPEQDTGASKVIPEEDYRKTLPHLSPLIADICRLCASIGCHVSEALRFMEAGKIEGAVLCFRHKGGHVHRVEASPETVAVARRLLLSGPPTRDAVYKAVKRACLRAGVPQWSPGCFRHTFATNAIRTAAERGGPEAAAATAAAVARYLGHLSPVTTLRFYATTAVVPRVSGGYEDA